MAIDNTSETKIEIDRLYTVDLSKLLVFEIGVLSVLTLFIWAWKMMGLI